MHMFTNKRHADIQGAGRRLLRVKNFCYVKLVKHHPRAGRAVDGPGVPAVGRLRRRRQGAPAGQEGRVEEAGGECATRSMFYKRQ